MLRTFNEFVEGISQDRLVQEKANQCAQLIAEMGLEPYEFIDTYLESEEFDLLWIEQGTPQPPPVPQQAQPQQQGWNAQKPQGFMSRMGSAIKNAWQNFRQTGQQAGQDKQLYQQTQAVDQNVKQAQAAVTNLKQLIGKFNLGNKTQGFTQVVDGMLQQLTQLHNQWQKAQQDTSVGMQPTNSPPNMKNPMY